MISKLSQSEPNRPSVMQQSTQNSQTMYLVFNNSYLIQIMLKSNVLSNNGNLDKSFTWKKYNLLEFKFLLASKSDPAAATHMTTQFFCSIFENP